MFNDEMYSIRLLAIQSLVRLGEARIVLIADSQLMYILTAIYDTTEEIRQAVFIVLK
jgi:hypothetical protein